MKKIKSEHVLKLIRLHKQELEKQGPALKCKEHKIYTLSYCTNHNLFLCGECFQEHADNHCHTVKGTSKAMKSVLNKALKVLMKQQDKLANEIEKIKLMLKVIEHDHEKLLQVF